MTKNTGSIDDLQQDMIYPMREVRRYIPTAPGTFLGRSQEPRPWPGDRTRSPQHLL